jgi:hypothetical protein
MSVRFSYQKPFLRALELLEQNKFSDRERSKPSYAPEKLLDALSQLSLRELAAMLLYKFEGFSTFEIGQSVRNQMPKTATSPFCGVYSQLRHLTNTQVSSATFPCDREWRIGKTLATDSPYQSPI